MTALPSSSIAQITTHLTSRALTPSQSWLTHLFSTLKASTPLPALKQTALFRLLASDITTSLTATPASTFPPDIHDAHISSRRLIGPVAVQVLDIVDIGRSAYSQLEAFEAAERGETTKGREVVRVVPGELGLASEETGTGKGPFKLVMQDASGEKAFGVEVKPVEGLGGSMCIGAKVVLKNVVVARGFVLLDPEGVVVLGGKIESAHKAWMDGRLARLKAAVAVGSE